MSNTMVEVVQLEYQVLPMVAVVAGRPVPAALEIPRLLQPEQAL
jgi:hypothetical protein